jgi:hypothetical protein
VVVMDATVASLLLCTKHGGCTCQSVEINKSPVRGIESWAVQKKTHTRWLHGEDWVAVWVWV